MVNITSPITVMLGRLEKVTDSGGGQYTACCPAHEDRNPSLSIREIDDKLLLRCHAGCGANEIVAAVGLSLADLFNTPLTKDYVKPLPKQQRWNWRALLQTVAHESLVVEFAAGDMSKNSTLSDDDKERLAEAVTRIRAVVELVT